MRTHHSRATNRCEPSCVCWVFFIMNEPTKDPQHPADDPGRSSLLLILQHPRESGSSPLGLFYTTALDCFVVVPARFNQPLTNPHRHASFERNRRDRAILRRQQDPKVSESRSLSTLCRGGGWLAPPLGSLRLHPTYFFLLLLSPPFSFLRPQRPHCHGHGSRGGTVG